MIPFNPYLHCLTQFACLLSYSRVEYIGFTVNAASICMLGALRDYTACDLCTARLVSHLEGVVDLCTVPYGIQYENGGRKATFWSSFHS